ncbi:hypothetical protein BUALT_Bualt06G0036400 [Buddleja alternifolia]|uniref:Pre-rRNA-processing protein RIX1 N-terminal domain-containing protein n=1 Tax=Buddleja alternifolia TaxID=168488 RepID=A0AAV6XC35_9LAMI|nr:hypothetical protein BUALT_Bualt06G0036400 [Buddleja alternifolia]
MAASSDVALKSKLLRSLLRDYVPDHKHAFTNPSELSYVVSTVKTHKLLSEWAPQPLQQDLIDAWKSAVDSWVHRLLTLASSNLPDKCWAGICLLGVTIEECSSERFLASYAVWLDKLISHIQPPAVSHFVKVASCASLSDMFSRLSGFSNAKKDGTSHATKIVQPALKLLNEDISAVVLEEAMCLLCTLIDFFPASINRHYDSVEAAIVMKLMSGKCSSSLLKKLAYGLSSLPKSRGDEDSWSLMMEKILICVNSQLNDAFQGLEEEARSTEMMRALLPAGKEPPPPLGGLAASVENSDLLTRRPERLLGSRISILMQCCCDMLSSSYPVTVPVPIRALVALAGRVLMVDGSLSLSSYSLMTTLKQEFICSEIPLLQSHSLEILLAVVKGLNSHLLPHVADIAQLLTEYLRRCKLPGLRLKAYSIVKGLLMSMGIGLAIHVSQEVVSNVFIDLDDGKSSGIHSKVLVELLSESRQKKRKHSSTTQTFQEQPAHDGLQVETPQNSTPLTVKIAALEALEALLIVGGSMRSESWREEIDDLLINVATSACKGGWSKDERNIFLSGDHTPIWADFQLAALRALLASLLSPCQVRPSHLARGLELFRRGTKGMSTKLAEFCGHALLTLEVLIHPRALPLLDMHSSIDVYKTVSHKLPNTLYSSGPRQISTYQTGTLGKGHEEPENDEIHENWTENDDELEIPVADRKRDHFLEQLPSSSKDASITPIPIENEKNTSDRDDYMVDDHLSAQSGMDASESVELEPMSKRIATMEKDIAVKKSDVITEVCEGEMASASTKDDGVTTVVERISATLSNADTSIGLMFESDNELSIDSLPDIVDGDPDSD